MPSTTENTRRNSNRNQKTANYTSLLNNLSKRQEEINRIERLNIEPKLDLFEKPGDLE